MLEVDYPKRSRETDIYILDQASSRFVDSVKVYFQTIGIVKTTWRSSQKKMRKSSFAIDAMHGKVKMQKNRLSKTLKALTPIRLY
jgi:hypothetical protein